MSRITFAVTVGPDRTRQYRSPLRDDQQQRTRARILDAAIQRVAEEGVAELTIPLVAERAGVSLRTVYRHFPTKDDLIEKIGDSRDAQLGITHQPGSIEALLADMPALFELFHEHDDLVRTADVSRAGREVHDRARKRRAANLERIFEEVTRELSPTEARRLLAAVQALWSTRAWLTMHDSWGLDGREAGEAAQWAIGVLIDEARRLGAAG